MKRIQITPIRWTLAIFIAAVFLVGCSGNTDNSDSANSASPSEYEIVTLLPKDTIRSIDDPQFYSSTAADFEYEADELVLGVVFDGESRAYSIDLLSQHEIVNDTVRGHPIAVTW